MSDEIIVQCADPKEAALRALLQKFEEIDRDASTRGAFGGSIVFSQMNHMDKPIFDNEITLIREVLGIKPTETKQVDPVTEIKLEGERRGLFDDL